MKLTVNAYCTYDRESFSGLERNWYFVFEYSDTIYAGDLIRKIQNDIRKELVRKDAMVGGIRKTTNVVIELPN